MTTRRRPLEGIRVLDLGRVIAAPYCSQMLADYGADVIKIERPKLGDEARSMTAGCLLDDAGEKILTETSIFVMGNRGKRSVTLDLRLPEGRDLLERLAAVSDVLVENFVPGTMRRFGLDYESLRTISPRLVYVSISGYGQTGPYTRRPGFDAMLQAVTGFMSVTGPRDDGPCAQPVRVGSSVIDIGTGMNAAFAILVALRECDASGEGQHIDVSLFDTGIALQGENVQKFLFSGDRIGRHGTENYGGAPARVFRVADGEVYIIAGLPNLFEPFCRTIGCPELPADPRFIGVLPKWQNRDALYAIIEPILAKWKQADLIEALEEAQVPCAAVNDYAALFGDPHAAARGVKVHLDHPKSKRLDVIASPMKLSRTPAELRRPPMLGEHTDQVLKDVAGLDEGEIDRLRERGVV